MARLKDGYITRAKHHFLENDDLRSILVPADPDESTFTATKGSHSSAFVCLTLLGVYWWLLKEVALDLGIFKEPLIRIC